jgi:hypothetical protein
MNRLNFKWILLRFTLAAFALLVYHLDTQSLWYDEGSPVFLAGQSLAAITIGKLNPPLYYYPLHFWLLPAGATGFAIRFLSIKWLAGFTSDCLAEHTTIRSLNGSTNSRALVYRPISFSLFTGSVHVRASCNPFPII